MLISVDGEELFVFSNPQKYVMANEISAANVDGYLRLFLEQTLLDEYGERFNRFKKEWDPKLKANGVVNIPTDRDEYTMLVIKQPDYEDYSMRMKDV